jgi:hypothetical protein
MNGKTAFSSADSKYEEPLKELLRGQIGSEHACSPEVHGER